MAPELSPKKFVILQDVNPHVYYVEKFTVPEGERWFVVTYRGTERTFVKGFGTICYDHSCVPSFENAEKAFEQWCEWYIKN